VDASQRLSIRQKSEETGALDVQKVTSYRRVIGQYEYEVDDARGWNLA
jgi:hypothetical protein